jgi:hypothetical protein
VEVRGVTAIDWEEVWDAIDQCAHDYTSPQLWVDPNNTRLWLSTCRECGVGSLRLESDPMMTGRWLAEHLKGVERVA